MFPSAETIQIVLPVISILFLVLSFYRNIYGVISFLIITNAKLGVMYPALGAIRFELVAAVVIFISIFLSGGLNYFMARKNHPITKSLIVLFILVLLSVPFSVDVAVSWDLGGYEFMRLFLFYVMVICSIRDKADFQKFIWAIVLVTAWVAYEPVVNYLNGIFKSTGYGKVATGRYGAATGHVALANTLCQAIPIVYYLSMVSRKKIAPIVIMLFLVIGVIFTKSRGGFVGLVTVAVGILCFSESRKKTVAAMGLVFLLTLPFAGGMYFDHIATIADGIHGSRSAQDRYLGFVNGIEMAIKRPLLGVGIGCYAEARSQYFRYYFYSHNLYGEVIGELGLASLAWFIWIYQMLKQSHYLKKRLNRKINSENYYYQILTAVQVCLFVRLMIGNFSHSLIIWFWFAMAAAIVGIEGLWMNQKQAANEESDNVTSPANHYG